MRQTAGNFIQPGFFMLLMAGCGAVGGGSSYSSMKSLAIDPDLRGSVMVGICEDRLDCRDNEIVFHDSRDGRRFERTYKAKGYLSWEETRIFWNEPAATIEIGSILDDKVTSLCNNEYEDVCDLKLSVSYPNSDPGVTSPIYIADFRLKLQDRAPASGNEDASRTALLKYTIASPNQEDGGTCLYMASTGAMEILLNQSRESDGLAIDGSTDGAADISEPYLINIDGSFGMREILKFNQAESKALLHRDFPFQNTATGQSAKANWNLSIPDAERIPVPLAKIYNIHGGTTLSDKSKWYVDVMNDTHIEQIKEELKKDRPVLVTYSHFGIWHVVVVVGYDDTAAADCDYVNAFIDPAFGVATASVNKVKAALEREGGCRDKGIFYVRDSLGSKGAARAPRYDTRSYDWVKFLGNHALSVYR